MNNKTINIIKCILCLLGPLALALSVQAASFDCTKAQSKVEHLICDNPKLSDLDNKLSQDYQDVLSKANEEQKQHAMVEQKYWLKFTRNVCENETCLKHAYWSRQAALETFLEPHTNSYNKESEKAGVIKQILGSAPLYLVNGTQFCSQIFEDLKQMQDVKFVEPIVQTQSYEDPALDQWKKGSSEPLNFTYTCLGSDYTADHDLALSQCKVNYGLPPFKVFELHLQQPSGQKQYYFYFDSAYGPMNLDLHYSKKRIEYRSELKQINAQQENVLFQTMVGKPNYNSVIVYNNQYYLLTLFVNNSSNWLNIDLIDSYKSENRQSCSWSPVK